MMGVDSTLRLPLLDPHLTLWLWRALSLMTLLVIWWAVAPWTWPSYTTWFCGAIMVLLLWGSRAAVPASVITQVIILEGATLGLRIGLVPHYAANPIDLILWSFLRDGVCWFPALLFAFAARRWAWCGWGALSIMMVNVILMAVSAGVARVLSRPLDWSLLTTAFGGPDVARMTIDGGALSLALVLAMSALLMVRVRYLTISHFMFRSLTGMAVALVFAAGIHEPLRRSILTTWIPIHLDATNAFSPVWLTIQRWGKAGNESLPPWNTETTQTLLSIIPPAMVPAHKPYADLIGRYRGMNVLIMLMESFRAESLGIFRAHSQETSSSPEFDELCRQGLLFTGYVPTGQYSGHALWSIFTGLAYTYPWHALHHVAYDVNRPVASWEWPGYHYTMICATDPRFDSYSSFTRQIGWDYVQVPALSPTGGYGTHDETALPWAIDHLAQQSGPWVGLVFSVSNHWPFEHPGVDHSRPLRSGIAYSDRAVGTAIRRFREHHAEVAARTVIVVVGDHGVRQELFPPINVADPLFQPAANRIPMLVLLPDGRCAGERDHELVSHVDLQPMLADLCHESALTNGLGRSPLRAWEHRWAITGITDASPPGILLWKDHDCRYVTMDGILPLIPTTAVSANQSWWFTSGNPSKDPTAQGLLRALRAMQGLPDLHWRSPDTVPLR